MLCNVYTYDFPEIRVAILTRIIVSLHRYWIKVRIIHKLFIFRHHKLKKPWLSLRILLIKPDFYRTQNTIDERCLEFTTPAVHFPCLVWMVWFEMNAMPGCQIHLTFWDGILRWTKNLPPLCFAKSEPWIFGQN